MARFWFWVQLEVKVLTFVCASAAQNEGVVCCLRKQLSTLLNRTGPLGAGSVVIQSHVCVLEPRYKETQIAYPGFQIAQ